MGRLARWLGRAAQTTRDTAGMATLAVFGYGNMGQAVIEGAVRAKVVDARDVLVVEPDPSKRDDAARLGCRVGIAQEARSSTAALLAVKPQSFAELAPQLSGRSGRTTFISVMAGLSGESILRAIGDGTPHAVIRAMPNTPCRLGEGMTGIALSPAAVAGDELLAERLFGAVGRTARVDESMLDAVTATSASGPAYLFLLAEAWELAAIELGFDAVTARELVRQTIVGAARMLEDRSADAASLRAAVTSKGGTTAAAVAVLEARGFADAMRDALAAAARRGRELGR